MKTLTLNGEELDPKEYITLLEASEITNKPYETIKSYAKVKPAGNLSLRFIKADNGLRYTTRTWVHEFLYELNKNSSHYNNKRPAAYITPSQRIDSDTRTIDSDTHSINSNTKTPPNETIPNNTANFMRCSEVARYLGLTRQRVHQMVKAGQLVSVRDPYYGLVIPLEVVEKEKMKREKRVQK